MAKDSAFDLAIIAVVNLLMFLIIQDTISTNYPDMNPTLIAVIATFISTFVMAYLFRRKGKKK